MKHKTALSSLFVVLLVAGSVTHHLYALPQKEKPFTQRLFTDSPSIEPETPQAKRLADTVRKDLLAPISLKALKSKVGAVKRKRFATTKDSFSAGESTEPFTTGSVKTPQGRLFVTFIRNADGTILGVIDSFAVAPSLRGSTGKRVGELVRLGFKVNKIVMLYQIAYWRKRTGETVARRVSHAPDFITPLLNPKEAASALNLRASAPPRARGAKATTQSADVVPPAVAMAVASSHEPETPVVSHPEGTPSGADSNAPSAGEGPSSPPPTVDPVTTGTPPDEEPPSDCILEAVDGILKQCCKTPYSEFHNCTAFASEFNKGCAERDLSCKSVDIDCPGAVPHRANILMLSDGSWVPVEPQPSSKNPGQPVGVMPGVRLSGPDVPQEVACKMVGLTPEDCGCVPDEAPEGGMNCGCTVHVRDDNPKPNSDPDHCAHNLRAGLDMFDNPLPNPPTGTEDPYYMRHFCLKCCRERWAESDSWRRNCGTACLMAFTPTQVPGEMTVSD